MRIRRGRRTDFTGVMQLLATSGVALPPPDRATLRRFRNIVADLGADFYIAAIDGTLAGLVHVTYARRLAARPQAQLDQLVVADAVRRRGIGSALLAVAQERARRRGCAQLSCALAAADAPAREFLRKAGLQPVGECCVKYLEVEG
jgi:N-acetylglutamate synthase-like GNAT family acetyltransferase